MNTTYIWEEKWHFQWLTTWKSISQNTSLCKWMFENCNSLCQFFSVDSLAVESSFTRKNCVLTCLLYERWSVQKLSALSLFSYVPIYMITLVAFFPFIRSFFLSTHRSQFRIAYRQSTYRFIKRTDGENYLKESASGEIFLWWKMVRIGNGWNTEKEEKYFRCCV